MDVTVTPALDIREFLDSGGGLRAVRVLLEDVSDASWWHVEAELGLCDGMHLATLDLTVFGRRDDPDRFLADMEAKHAALLRLEEHIRQLRMAYGQILRDVANDYLP
jgi:hypothetical protein